MKSKNNKKYYKNCQNQSSSERFLKSKNPTVGAVISCYFKKNSFQKLLWKFECDSTIKSKVTVILIYYFSLARSDLLLLLDVFHLP